MAEPGATYLLECIKSFKGLKSTAEKALAQITDEELHDQPDPDSNSVALLLQHLTGNMLSRFTDFLTSDGEKATRNRDAEFEDGGKTRQDLLKEWNEAWSVLITTLENLRPEDLITVVFIRNEPHSVIRAIQRQLVHYAYHTGQIVFICKMIRKDRFASLSIPKGKSGDFQDIPPPAR